VGKEEEYKKCLACNGTGRVSTSTLYLLAFKHGIMVELTPGGVNTNRIPDDLDNLDKKFCRTMDKLLDLYRRVMIVAHKKDEELREGYKKDLKDLNTLVKDRK